MPASKEISSYRMWRPADTGQVGGRGGGAGLTVYGGWKLFSNLTWICFSLGDSFRYSKSYDNNCPSCRESSLTSTVDLLESSLLVIGSAVIHTAYTLQNEAAKRFRHILPLPTLFPGVGNRTANFPGKPAYLGEETLFSNYRSL